LADNAIADRFPEALSRIGLIVCLKFWSPTIEYGREIFPIDPPNLDICIGFVAGNEDMVDCLISG
jgi:hypothetical protein